MKKGLLFIIGFTAVALLGIVSLQAYWIGHAWKLKEDEFDKAVYNSLDGVRNRISKREVIQIMGYSGYAEQTVSGAPVRWEDSAFVMRTEIRHSSDNGKHTLSRIQISSGPGPEPAGDETAAVNSWMQVMDSVKINYREMPHMVIRNVVSDVLLEMGRPGYSWLRNTPPELLQEMIREELDEKDISLPFIFTVSSSSAPEEPYKSSRADTVNPAYSLDLSDFASRDEFIRVYFPGKRNYVMHSLLPMILLSLVLSLLAAAGFGIIIRMVLRLKKLSALKTAFINNMTHEFKTPLATMMIAADTLNNPKTYADPKLVQQYTEMLKEEGRMMSHHIDTVLQAALLERDKLEIRMEKTEAQEVIRRAVANMKWQIAASGAEIVIDIPQLPVCIRCDADHLVTVIMNLLSNAIKYSEGMPQIRIGMTTSAEVVSITVSDRGTGIRKKDLPYIFDAFFRADTGNLHPVKGFGLGLNYVRRMIGHHDGKITVKSEPGKGSEFTVILKTYHES